MYQDAHHYLHEIREAYAFIKTAQKSIEQYDWMIDASAINYDRDRVQSSPRQDGLEMQAIRHMEAVAKLRAKMSEAIEWRTKRIDEATALISKIDSKDQRDVLIMRYIENKTWSDILEARGCDDLRSQYQLHNRAIESFQNVLNHYITTI
jgi:hypothetical protein